MTQIDKIRQEIERRIKELDNDKYINIDAKACRVSELGHLKRFLDTLSVEAPEGLDEAAEEYADLEKASYNAVCRIFGCDPMYFGNKAEITAGECDYLFRAGAEWAFGQGVSFDTTVGWFDGKTIMDWPEDITDSFELGDKVIVQIRKK